MDQSLYNEDLAPTKPEERTWNQWHIAALWVGMAVCIPTYALAADLIVKGAALSTAVLAVGIGNLVVLVPLILNGHPGAKYGIPFPVLIRSSFGPVGAHIPTMIRALVACGWFGIQTWIGGSALHALAVTMFPDTSMVQFMPEFIGISTGEFLAFSAFWLINVAIIIGGLETLKKFETWAAPFLILAGIAMLVWAWLQAGDKGASFGDVLAVNPAPDKSLPGTTALALGITGAVSFWGTLALNIPDFTRYAKSQKDQAVGQAISLPTTMTLYVFIGAAVTNATFIIFGAAESNPVTVLTKIGGPFVSLLAIVGLIVATLSTNLAANVVSPANGFANLAPQKLNFRKGALITAGLGFVILPWKILADIVPWLIGAGGFLGAVGGIMIADYFLIRKTELDIDDLYKRGGKYEYRGGLNPMALIALLVGIAPLMPGFLHNLGFLTAPVLFVDLYNWSWFVAFLLAGGVYYAGTRISGRE